MLLAVVIIHHAAVNQVDSEELQYLYHHKRLVVVGIGISTDKMEEMIDEPIFDELRNVEGPNNDICNNAICSVIYSTRDSRGAVDFEGSDDRKDLLFGDSSERQNRTTDLLNNEDSIHRMWNSIKVSVWEMQRDYQSNDKARPTLTIAEIEEMLKDPNHQ